MEGLQHSTAFFFRAERSPPKQLSGVRNSEIKVSSPCNCNDEIRFRQSRNKPTKRLEKVSGQEYRKPRNSVQVRFSLISEGKDFPGVCQCYGSTSFRIDVDHLFIRKSGDQSRDDSEHLNSVTESFHLLVYLSVASPRPSCPWVFAPMEYSCPDRNITRV